MLEDPYLYPGTGILRNKLNIRDAKALDRVERRLVTQRMIEGVPGGGFDLAHLRAIHRHLFQDVYDWAGELRTVEMSKAGTGFQPLRYIEQGMADLHRRIVAANHLKGRSRTEFARDAGEIIGDLNHVHPFREGNGRAQLVFLKQLAAAARHSIDLSRLLGPAWIAASRAANDGRYEAMCRCIEAAIRTDELP